LFTVVRKYRTGRKDFPVYTEDEAKDLGIRYKHWKDCDVDDWGISDDGFVAVCVGKKVYPSDELVKFPYGCMFTHGKGKLLFEPHWESQSFNGIGYGDWKEQEMRRTRTKDAVKLYVGYLMSGDKPDWGKIGNVYRPDQKRPDLTAKRLFKTEGIQKMIDKEMQRIFEEKGITKGSVVDLRMEAIEIAKSKSDSANMLRGVEGLESLMGMKPTSKTVTDTLELDATSQVSDLIEKEDVKLRLSRKRPTEELEDAEDGEIVFDAESKE